MADASSSFLVIKWRHDDITSDIVKSYLSLANFLILSNRPDYLSIFLLNVYFEGNLDSAPVAGGKRLSPVWIGLNLLQDLFKCYFALETYRDDATTTATVKQANSVTTGGAASIVTHRVTADRRVAVNQISAVQNVTRSRLTASAGISRNQESFAL